MNDIQAVPAYSLYGQPATDARLAHMDGARLAAASAPYLGRGNKCTGNDDTCEGMRAKGTAYCMGHLRSIQKKKGGDIDGDDEAYATADS
jgi:hypothetical protein